MNPTLNQQAFPADAVAELVARFGLWRVAAALVAHLLQRRAARPPDAANLPDYLRRDMGLAELPPLMPRLERPRHDPRWENPAFRW